MKPPSKDYLKRMVKSPSKEYLAGTGKTSAPASPSKLEVMRSKNSEPALPLQSGVDATRQADNAVMTEHHKLQAKHVAATDSEPSAPAVDLQAWQVEGLAANWTLADVLGSDMFLFFCLAVSLYAILAYLCTEPPAPVLATCTWHWNAFRCSTGCKIHMHLPGLQESCEPM